MIKRYPYLNFIIKDNPYGCSKNIFRYRFNIPVYLHVYNRDNSVTHYGMVKNLHNYNLPYFTDKVHNLLKDYTINNQTLSMIKESLSIDYQPPFEVEESYLSEYNIVPNNLKPIHYKNLCNLDIFIPLEFQHNKLFVNKPVWNKI